MKDNASKLTPAQLADKSGRRRSREFIDQESAKQEVHAAEYTRRKSKSREIDEADMEQLQKIAANAQASS